MRIPVLAVAAVALMGCTPTISQRGYLPDPAAEASIKVGTDTKTSIQKLLGDPSTSATFNEDAWYYVSSTERQVAFPGFADSLHASYDADVAQAFAEVGYAMSAGSLAVEPFGGLAYVGLHTNGFSETGGAAALTGAGGDTDITYGSLGARFGTTLPIGGGRAIARGMIAWQHALDGVTPKSVLAFDGGTGLPFFGRRHPDRRGHAEARGRPRLGARRSRDRKPRLFWRDRGACAGPRAQGEAIDQLLARRTAHRPTPPTSSPSPSRRVLAAASARPRMRVATHR